MYQAMIIQYQACTGNAAQITFINSDAFKEHQRENLYKGISNKKDYDTDTASSERVQSTNQIQSHAFWVM